MRFGYSKYRFIKGYAHPLVNCPALMNPRHGIRRARRRVKTHLELKQFHTRSEFLRNDKVNRLRFGREGWVSKVRSVVFPNLFRHLEW